MTIQQRIGQRWCFTENDKYFILEVINFNKNYCHKVIINNIHAETYPIGYISNWGKLECNRYIKLLKNQNSI